MIQLEKEFVSGDGGFSTNPLTYKQVKRTESVALYERSFEGKLRDYEVFIIRVDPKGKVQKFPNGITKTLEDDTEKYPSSGQWGRLAWSAVTIEQAMRRFDNLVAAGIQAAEEEENPTPKEAIVIPLGEFTVGELATKNNIEYAPAFLFIKAELTKGAVKFLREERRNAKGKASKIYIRA